MADNEKYYYIKLKDNYFEQDNIKVLESMKNGHIYSLIIIKLYLKASKTDGQLMMTQRIPYDPNNVNILANVIGHDVDHVKEAIRLGVELDLIRVIEGREIWMTEIQNMIGQSSTEADRVRLYRKELDAKALPKSKDVQMYDKCTPEIEKEIEIKKELKIDTYSEVCTEIISYLNEKTSSRYRSTDSTKKLIHARMEEGFTKEDFFKVIDNKVRSWKGTEWEKFLRPENLFSVPRSSRGISTKSQQRKSMPGQRKGIPSICQNMRRYKEIGMDFSAMVKEMRDMRDSREIEEYGKILSDEERDEIIEKEKLQREIELADKKKRQAEERLQELKKKWYYSVPPRFRESSFENFECANSKQKAVVEYLKTGKSAVIYGSNGTGKTHLAFATCRNQIKQGINAGYILAFDFFNKIRKSFSDGTTEDIMDRYSNYQLLVIDEIDKTQGTQTEFMYLYSLINERYNYMRSTILITNAKPDEFAAIIGQSALDRVASEGKVIDLTGDNYRQKK